MSSEFINTIPIQLCKVDYDNSAYYIEARFTCCDGFPCSPWITEGWLPTTLADIQAGRIRFKIPQAIYAKAGIYRYSVALMSKATKRPLYVKSGIIAVERTLFKDESCNWCQVMLPTLSDVRRKIDDFVGKNTFTKQLEFTDSDIIYAMETPIRLWNEQPPLSRRLRFNCSNFPFYEHWIIGSAAELLDRAVYHYMRNKMNTSAAGVSGNEYNRDADYLRVASSKREEYMQWAIITKKSMNKNQTQQRILSPFSANRGMGWGNE